MAKKKLNSENKPSRDNANQFDMLYPILESVYNEIKELSKKKQDGCLKRAKGQDD